MIRAPARYKDWIVRDYCPAVQLLEPGATRETVTLAGAVVLAPVPAFYYYRPRTIDDILRQTAGKALDQFGIEHNLFERWA